MGILYNANLTPAMNDVSVTSGNADGWVYFAGALDPSLIRAAMEKGTRRPADNGAPVTSPKSPKRRKR
jgi:hypothetical protein